MKLEELDGLDTNYYPCPLCGEIHEFENICLEQLEEGLRNELLHELKVINDKKEIIREETNNGN